ncbi:hypothetical protein [Amycolatopsis sp. 195334CR]|uniref:hypothetical protein n=1 Tax=Amycolatopsis sp. 195334CR TaxID=2814588 RepID=UPI001A8D26D5|nr:hypothetical protein [Amycolatopsis sp. 195334CR]MBN6039633.1 hypothetical protein [Amycolatopsis sp. 195334CR]
MRNRIRAMVAAGAVGAAALALASPVIAEEAPGASTGIRAVVQIAQPASATEVAALDFAIQADSHGCSGNEVSNNSYVHVCFVRDGDKIFVRDYCLNPNTTAYYRGYDTKGDSTDHFTAWQSEPTS